MSDDDGSGGGDRRYVGRLAPSPTGALHLGNARTFLIAWLRARSVGGRLIMRMEDLDHPKVKPHTVEQVYFDLRWLGMDWDEGPDIGGPHAPYVQTQRLDLYRAAFHALQEMGRVYPCTCTRADIANAQSAPNDGDDHEMHYPSTCRGRYVDADDAHRQTGRIPAWRFRLPDDTRDDADDDGGTDAARDGDGDAHVDGAGVSEFVDGFAGVQRSRLSRWSGDFVVARNADAPAYQLAVVVDDAAMGITEVVRGDDLIPSTHRQLALYRALNLTPPSFFHVPLVVGSDGRRLAKRHGDTRISTIRTAGTPPDLVVGWLAATLNLFAPPTARAAAAGTASDAASVPRLMPMDLLPYFATEKLPHDRLIVTAADHALLGLH